MNITEQSVVNKPDCDIIVQKWLLTSDKFEVLDFAVVPFSENSCGFLSECFSIKIKISSNNEEKDLRFFAKRFLYNEKDQSECAFLNEIFAYDILFEKFNAIPSYKTDFAPKYCFSKDNDLIVLEDLSVENYTVPIDPNDLDINHIKLVLKSVAKLHAGSIIFQESKSRELRRKYKITDEYAKFLNEKVFRKDETFVSYQWFPARLKGLNALIDLLPEFALSREEFKQKLAEVAENCFEIIQPKPEFYNVVSHGDLWGKNLMFKYENGIPIDCKLVDFQLFRYAPPAHDVLHFIYLTTTPEARKNHLHNLFKHYYNCLKREVSEANLNINLILPFEDFEVTIHYLMPQILLANACYSTFQIGAPDFNKHAEYLNTNFKTLMLGDGTPFVRHLYETDPKYHKRANQVLEELHNLLTHPDLTVENCYEIVNNKIGNTDYQLLDYQITPLGPFSGYVGDHNKLKINIIDNNGRSTTLHLFAKFSPKNKAQLEMSTDADSYHKEIFAYTKFFPCLQKMEVKFITEFAPGCYYTRKNDVLIFDDLENQNYLLIQAKFDPFTFGQMKVVLKTVAKFHACSILFEARMSKKTGTQYRLNQEFQRELQEGMFLLDENNKLAKLVMTAMKSIPHLIDLFHKENTGMSSEVFKTKAGKICDLFYQLVKPSTQFRNVLCHGDLWFNNVLLKHEDRKPVDSRLIDFQNLRYCPPAHDLLFLIYTSTNRATRAKHMQDMLDCYYDDLRTILGMYEYNINDCYTYEEFMKSCKYLKCQAICATALYFSFIMAEGPLMKEYITSEEVFHNLFFVDRCDFIDVMCSKDPVYKERLCEIVRDLSELCEKEF